MEIKRDDPERRKSFRARHNCDDPGPKWKARYWSCYQWRAGAPVAESEEGINENFLAKVQQQTEKIKAMCKQKFPDDKKQRKACLQHHKAQWINSLKHETTGMVSRIPSGGECCDVEEGQSEEE
jgi:hypothetical protein